MSLTDRIIQALQKTNDVWYFNTPRTEFRIRCPYCGDSIKNSKSAHLYIQLNRPDSIYPFYCQRCTSQGVLNMKTLQDMGVHDMVLFSELQIANKNNKSLAITQEPPHVQQARLRPNHIIPKYDDSKDSDKLLYLKNRYMVNWNPDYLENYYIIYNLGSFLKENELPYRGPPNMENILYNNYLGFLSYDKTYIVLRNIKDDDFRYFNYKIYDGEGGDKLFISKSEVDMLTPTIDIVMSEGILDLIAIRRFIWKDKPNTIYTAMNGKGYKHALDIISRLGFLSLNAHIYSDVDVPLNYFRGLKRDIPSFKYNTTNIYYNELGKDFGVPPKDIKIKQYELT